MSVLENNNDVFVRVFRELVETAREQKPDHPLNPIYQSLVEFIDAGGDRELSVQRVTAVHLLVATVGAIHPPTLERTIVMSGALQENVKEPMLKIAQEYRLELMMRDPEIKLPVM